MISTREYTPFEKFTNSVVPALEAQIDELKKTNAELVAQKELLAEISSYLNSYIQITNKGTEDELTTLVNEALLTIFDDQSISIRLDKKVIGFKVFYQIMVLEDGIEGSVDSYGGGILAVIAVILKIIFLVKTQSYPILFLDESLGFVSEQYQAKLSAFLKAFSHKMGITILLVSHQVTMMTYADNVITIGE